MKLLIGLTVVGAISGAAALQVVSYVKQPLDTLNYLYGHTEQISASVADGTYHGIGANQQTVTNGINSLPSSGQQQAAKSNLESIQSVYAQLDQVEQQ